MTHLAMTSATYKDAVWRAEVGVGLLETEGGGVEGEREGMGTMP